MTIPYAGSSAPMDSVPGGQAGPGPGGVDMNKIMGQIALAYIQNALSQQDQQGQSDDPITEALEGQDPSQQGGPPGQQAPVTPSDLSGGPGMGISAPQGMAIPAGIGGQGGMPFVAGRHAGSSGGKTIVKGGSFGGRGFGGSHSTRAKSPPVAKIKVPKPGKTPPPA